jgi:flagellar protein FliO/FliZ
MTELIPVARSLGALCLLIGLLAAALWAVRRYGIVLPGMVAQRPEKRLALVERLAVDGKRSLLLVRRDATEHLLLTGPDGVQVIERKIAPVPTPRADLRPDAQDGLADLPPAPDSTAQIRALSRWSDRARRMAQMDAAL